MIREIFSAIGYLLFSLWLWVPLVIAIVYLAWQNIRKAKWVQSTDYELLLLEIPRTNEKKELAAEQLFASLHGILRSKREIAKTGSLQEHISFEIASIGKLIRFYVHTPKHLHDFVEGQIYAQYPDAQITKLDEDYAKRDLGSKVIHTAELTLNTSDVLPIKTFPSFEVDPLAAITATLAKLETEGEELWVQILAKPIDDSWHRRGAASIDRLKKGGRISGSSIGMGKMFSYIQGGFRALFTPPEETKIEISDRARTQISAIEEKGNKLGYEVKIRIAYVGDNETTARLRMQAIVGTFKQYNSTNLNGFRMTQPTFGPKGVNEYAARYFHKHGYTMNIEEVASIWHLPHTNVETPNIVWRNVKTAEPPAILPTLENTDESQVSLFGATNFRTRHLQFGLQRSDRDRHLYIIGQTGTGKSGLLKLLTLSDIYGGQGFGLIDPHGDLATGVLEYIPEHRLKDVIYFNPADREFPIAFNPLEVTDPTLKNHISSELVGVMKRMFDSWGPRLEYILRYTLLALLDYPNSTMLDITRMLTEKGFRDDVIDHLTDPVVRNFWTKEFASWNEKFATEAVAPVLNKVGAFTANPMIRNIVGQPKSSINIRKAMDEGKILIVNLSRGLVGEDNAAILGALMVTKIQLAAMSRADMPEAERRPFYLYVDEFQNFATDSFAVILSEARKYGLNLTVANQYVSQMIPEVKDAIFGNVGSFVFFRVGADDASALTKYVQPQFEPEDLINMANRHFVAGLTVGGEKTHPFSGTSLNIPETENNFLSVIVDNSRRDFAKSRLLVEEHIAKIDQASYAKGASHHQKQSSGHSGGNNAQQQSNKSQNNHKKTRSKNNSNKNSSNQNRNNSHKPTSQPEQKPKTSDGSFDNDTTIHLH